MKQETILFEVKDQTGILTINRPQALNALNSQVLQELEERLENDCISMLRCLIITGSGSAAFVAGADIGEMCRLTVEEAQCFSRLGNRIFRKIERLPIPVIAAVNGYALGGGCELAMSCDFIVASDTAVFAQPETGLGITPGFGGTQRLARLIGPARAKEVIYTGRRIYAEEALRIGLVTSVIEKEQLLEEALKIAEKISKNGKTAIEKSKRAICEGWNLSIEEGIKREAQLFGECFADCEQQRRMDAFLRKK